MARRRFLPLIVLTVLGTIWLLLRLAQVQIVEHEVWAEEAANLVRKGNIVPFVRGEIRDRRGRRVVVDRQLYEVEFVYRDFRRGHPLGLVAHAWSTLHLLPVPLDEARPRLVPWARALASLTPGDLSRFAEGKGIETPDLRIPPSPEGGGDLVLHRSRDLSYYIAELVGLDRADRKALRKLPDDVKEQTSYLQFAARRRGRNADEFLVELEQRIDDSTRFLIRLANLREESEGQGVNAGGASPLDRLVADLERRRRRVEDQAAGDLFGAAAGFAAGRLEPAQIARHFDLAWLSKRMCWDAQRTEEWLLESRKSWLKSLDEYVLPRLALEMVFARREGKDAQCVLDQLASLYVSSEEWGREGERRDWKSFERLQVFDELPDLFEVRLPRRLAKQTPQLLPIQDERLRKAAFEGADEFEMLARVEAWSGPSAEDVAPGALRAGASQWRELLDDRNEAGLRARCRELIEGWEAWFSVGLDQRFAKLRELHRDQDGSGDRLKWSRGRLDRAQERADYSLIDRGSRPVRVMSRANYDVVHLITRYPEWFRGFEVKRSHRRVPLTRDYAGRPLAQALIGGIRKPQLEELRMQQEQVLKFEELRRLGQRDEEDQVKLENLVRSIDQPDDWRGASGIEAQFDRELSGKNGYEESSGLQERAHHSRFVQQSIKRVDGQPLELTLDLDLQREALFCLEHPSPDPDKNSRDLEWLAAPTGALVLMTVEGEVLAAASVPVQDRPRADGSMTTRDQARERTLTKPDFQPAGSVFKPLAAVFALDRLGLDPTEVVECKREAGEPRAAYKGLGCWKKHGHGEVDLEGALIGSCNCYFAWLGESHYTAQDFKALADEFGFGHPTGVRTVGDRRRRGLLEDTVPEIFTRRFRPRNFLEAGNGLGIVEVTPMQVARAFAGLASGVLPQVRLVRRVGEGVFEARGRRLSLSDASLQRVRDSLLLVTNDCKGSAHKALQATLCRKCGNRIPSDRRPIGFPMAAKTGSADLTSEGRLINGEERVPKHTWVAGWFPADEPRFVLVVFVNRTYFTSSHNAAWIAQQFLTRDVVIRWLADQGVVP
jgi:penicillin-binding protein 2